MNNKRLFKILIIAQWIAIIAAIVMGLIEERSLPDTLRAYVLEAESRELSSSEKIAYSFGTFLLVAYFISTIGLLRFKNWARWLYLGVNAAGLTAALFFGPQIITPVSGVLSDLSMALIGLTIGVVFVPEVRKEFGKTNGS
jgi:hypothetical protein